MICWPMMFHGADDRAKLLVSHRSWVGPINVALGLDTAAQTGFTLSPHGWSVRNCRVSSMNMFARLPYANGR